MWILTRWKTNKKVEKVTTRVLVVKQGKTALTEKEVTIMALLLVKEVTIMAPVTKELSSTVKLPVVKEVTIMAPVAKAVPVVKKVTMIPPVAK